ncbi:GNAT family N-acetyltransferase [Aeromonas cavernicola]|nr:GNAT family N-acetyltransferase [Aeromonas cavernicola]
MQAIWQLEAQIFGDELYPPLFFRQAMDLWPDLLLVAEHQGQLLGYILGAVGQDRSQGWLLSLAILADARGLGLAQRLIAQLEQNLRQVPIVSVRLTVSPDNPARQLYECLDYQRLTQVDDYFGPNESRLVLEKNLF